MKPEADLEKSMIGPLKMLVAFVKRKLAQDYSKSGRFFGRLPIIPFLDIFLSLTIDTPLKRLKIIQRRVFLDRENNFGTKIVLFLCGLTLEFLI